MPSHIRYLGGQSDGRLISSLQGCGRPVEGAGRAAGARAASPHGDLCLDQLGLGPATNRTDTGAGSRDAGATETGTGWSCNMQ
ncbi:hypothetical protein NDU88_005444 [Pleurodeles waltl]|uniref:Uncharacterized protein n=1 Tax=Pleurodeles waltl TaxID=8319 RepID=A0AAV7QIB7_PLEWA|nr:hypothetical protein NDU88_005444 [Pleurodeles waltl]